MEAIGADGTAALLAFLQQQRVMSLGDLQYLQLDWLASALQPAGVPMLQLNKFLSLARERAAHGAVQASSSH